MQVKVFLGTPKTKIGTFQMLFKGGSLKIKCHDTWCLPLCPRHPEFSDYISCMQLCLSIQFPCKVNDQSLPKKQTPDTDICSGSSSSRGLSSFPTLLSCLIMFLVRFLHSIKSNKSVETATVWNLFSVSQNMIHFQFIEITFFFSNKKMHAQ